MSWIAGVFCLGVVGALVWFAIPLLPAVADVVGGSLRAILP